MILNIITKVLGFFNVWVSDALSLKILVSYGSEAPHPRASAAKALLHNLEHPSAAGPGPQSEPFKCCHMRCMLG